MSNQPFSFPPPPPPPKRNPESIYHKPNGSQGSTGGSFRGGYSVRGNTRDSRGGRGGNRNAPLDHPSSYSQNSMKWFNDGPRQDSFIHPPQKRDHAAAFNPVNQPRPRPTAAPAVPSFNASIEHLLSRKPVVNQANQSASPPQPKKQNLLGLTPSKLEDDSNPEDDEDEENRLASHTNWNSQTLEFEYKGRTSTLRTPEDIAAWIAERRRRYPTQAKIEAAKKEAEKKKRKWEEEKRLRMDAKREAQRQRDKVRAGKQTVRGQTLEVQPRKYQQEADSKPVIDAAVRTKSKVEKLRKRALQAEQELAKAEEALRFAQPMQQVADTQSSARTSNQMLDLESEALDSSSDSDLTDSDATSSSGSSTTDSDSDNESREDGTPDSDTAPEILSTNQTRLGDGLRPTPPLAKPAKIPRPCKIFLKSGRCKYGSNCRYSHDISEKNPSSAQKDGGGSKKDISNPASVSTKRKGLFQVMVEKEREDERKRLLGAIIMLGEKGLLDETTRSPDTSAKASDSSP
ncbi:uncharacterized protein Z518_09373 [Rhinocladiella mackenziei CBS 650.93]|uniref:Rhinocladiella mackenziei CBS 650.93 unplaced genomic scaffold supercont1.7, whole genome shotgun sequence n=1 Tax=Rhinocladiella mackenziei CBS 650.93 TaxID=1442369 RepID=A0A0D2FI20_9EURO|nr:uncharacterized protein Z518_09373 [Rhinocladiella mackenziei CBS 650.93]KIX01647.1 hypothetical protein Z518_09373 [Rhinocladiella mackenziei CBS 650.93]